ncbi:MAG: M20/M25/M40 family metallo-hydrolase [Candidatus Eremiobacteraeota bacterium]|nr:M20/M25/M40 family metallo-hydrolase [Candidatus Eremiobacteraeota bacterium]
MDSLQFSASDISPRGIKAQAGVAAQAPSADEPHSTWQGIKDTVGESVEDGRLQGKKIGMLLAASAGAASLPLMVAQAAPAIAGTVLGPAGMIGALVVAAIEEKYIGIGKHAGALAGSAVGAGVGLVRAALNHGNPPDPNEGDRKVELPKAPPQGKGPWEPLLPRMLHKAEKAILGHVPERTRAIERAETIGLFGSSLVAASVIPTIAATLIGGPVATIMGTMIGSLIGIVGGSLEENTIGIGRVAGEAVGTVVSAVGKGIRKLTGSGQKVQEKDNAHQATETFSLDVQAAKKAPERKNPISTLLGYAGKAFMGLNSVMAEPLMSFLIDTSKLCNLLLTEKPVQTIDFKERPFPAVNKDRLVANFTKIAGINAKYKQEDAVASELGRQFDAMKVNHAKDQAGNLIATIPATESAKDAPTVMLSAHMDTVSPTSADAIINDGKKIKTNERHILGGDDRAGIAQIMEGVQSVLERGMDHPEIKIVFTVGEEVGLKGSMALDPKDIATRPTLGFVIDSTDKRSLYLTNDGVIITSKPTKYNFSQEDPLIQVSMRSMADAGIKPQPVHGPILAGAGTDANSPALNNKLVKSVAIGTGVNDVHTMLENAKIKDLEQIARSVVGFITNTCDLKVDGDAVVPRYPLKS